MNDPQPHRTLFECNRDRNESLCMSLYGVVADYLWNDYIKNLPTPIYIGIIYRNNFSLTLLPFLPDYNELMGFTPIGIAE